MAEEHDRVSWYHLNILGKTAPGTVAWSKSPRFVEKVRFMKGGVYLYHYPYVNLAVSHFVTLKGEMRWQSTN